MTAENPRAQCKWCGCVFEDDGQFSPQSTRRGCAYWSRGWLDGDVSVVERYPAWEFAAGPRLHVAADSWITWMPDERPDERLGQELLIKELVKQAVGR